MSTVRSTSIRKPRWYKDALVKASIQLQTGITKPIIKSQLKLFP